VRNSNDDSTGANTVADEGWEDIQVSPKVREAFDKAYRESCDGDLTDGLRAS